MPAGLAAAIGDVPGARPLVACKRSTCLPSSNSAYALMAGVRGAAPSVVLHFTGRALVIATGLWIGGFRGKDVLLGSVAGATLFEASLLVWAAMEVSRNADA